MMPEQNLAEASKLSEMESSFLASQHPLGLEMPVHSEPGCEEIDLSLLEDSLAKTPWERMLANDDALRFAESLRAAMEKRNAKSKPVA